MPLFGLPKQLTSGCSLVSGSVFSSFLKQNSFSLVSGEQKIFSRGIRFAWGSRFLHNVDSHRNFFISSSSSKSAVTENNVEMDGARKKSTHRSPVGIAFDIDGVLIRGGVVLHGAKKALQLCKEYSIPHIFLTNGGGVSETEKSSKLSKVLDSEIHEDQMQLSHTPMRELVTLYGDRPVLIIGSEKYVQVCRSYGFKKVFSPQMLAAIWPDVDPGRRYENYPVDEDTRKVIQDLGGGKDTIPCPDAVMVIHDPVDWHLEIAVLLEVLIPGAFERRYGNQDEAIKRAEKRMENLTSSGNTGSVAKVIPNVGIPKESLEVGNKKAVSNICPWRQIPFYISHTDFFGSCQYPYPRVNAGAFLLALSSLFKSVHGVDLQVQEYGKPHPVTYAHAKELLLNQALKIVGENNSLTSESSGHSAHASTAQLDFDVIYAIGDNASTDIKGANNAGDPWESILVKTGIFQSLHGNENDPENPAHHVKEDVLDAVLYIINKHFSTR